MGENGHSRIKIGEFDFDSRAAKLFRSGEPVRIQPQPLRVLQLLVERHGEIVSREDLHRHVWNGATFVEFDQGLNYCIRQIRLALGDNAARPTYVETLPKQGYRFIGEVRHPGNEVSSSSVTEVPPTTVITPQRRRWPWLLLVCASLAVCFALAAVKLYFRQHPSSAAVQYRQLTEFAESAVGPALSPDGRTVAFFRSNSYFLSSDQIWIKRVPEGEAKRLTNDRRWKCCQAFSTDGSQLFYTAVTGRRFQTYAVPLTGGEPHLVLDNAAGLQQVGPDEFLFSRIRSGLHMGVVLGSLKEQRFRDIYFPANERAMAHYSFTSPDRQKALVVEMEPSGLWGPCRLVSLNGGFNPTQAGPDGACTSAAWSPDGGWMYFTIEFNGGQHIWRQRYPQGAPQQITFGPLREVGLAMEPGGRSLITSLGLVEKSIWVHNPNGDRLLTTEGKLEGGESIEADWPSFSADTKRIYYLAPADQGADSELWSEEVESGKSRRVMPGVSMFSYDLSRDGKQVVFLNSADIGKGEICIASLGGSRALKRLRFPGAMLPFFGPDNQILFLRTNSNSGNHLEQVDQDGLHSRPVLPFPIVSLLGVSPARRWIFIAKAGSGTNLVNLAISLKGDPPRTLCTFPCFSSWSPDGKWLSVPVVHASNGDAGRSLMIPIGPDETLPPWPKEGIALDAQPGIVPGAQSIQREMIIPGSDPFHYAYMSRNVHQNLYRVSLP